jgi:cytochrome c oxidase assembly factor CtaG/cytochrome c551/c552
LNFDPGVAIPLVVTALLYAAGQRVRGSATGARKLLFWSGWAALAIALLSPIHEMGESLFSVHMLQHEILMLIAAPLLVLSRPLVPMLHGMPFSWRRALGRGSKTTPVRRTWNAVTHPAGAWSIHAAALWIWHYPPLFDATLENDWIHAAQHLSFLLSALLFWWSLFYARKRNAHGAGVLYIFTTAVHTSILGALLTLSTRPLYAAYAHSTAAFGLTPLEDQQIGGLIMWVPAGLVYMAAGLVLFARWLKTDSGAFRYAATLTIAAILPMGCGTSQQKQVAMNLTGGSPDAGASAIEKYGCGSCHSIPQIPGAHGLVGPPLAGIAVRTYVGGELPNHPDNLMHWIRHPHSVNPNTAMPELGVTQRDAQDIAAFLYSVD